MTPAETFALLALGILACANTFVSVAVLRSHYYSWAQKSVQVLIVWLVPAIGAVAIWSFLRAQEESDLFDSRANIERREKMIAPAVDTAIRETTGHVSGE